MILVNNSHTSCGFLKSRMKHARDFGRKWRREQAEEIERCHYSNSCVGEGRKIYVSTQIRLQLVKVTIPGIKVAC